MGTYIARRLLLMIPTLLGITFLVFMLVALAPGGIGASLKVQGGGTMQSQAGVAMQRAYLEDRYGLDDPVPVQYVRWLGRISPVKIGQRDQVDNSGNRVRSPKAVKRPPLWTWYAASLPSPAPAASPATTGRKDLQEQYRIGERRYAEARQEYLRAITLLKQGLTAYARAINLDTAVKPGGEPRLGVLAAVTPRTDVPEWRAVQALGADAVRAYKNAIDERARLAALFRKRPYDEAGFAVIPGFLSIAWPDFGYAYSQGRPVLELIARALPVTLLLNVIAFPIIYAVAIPGGMLAANYRGSRLDLGLGALFIGLYSIPVVLAGVFCIGFLASRDYLGAFPVSGLHANTASSMRFLPSFGEGGFRAGYLGDLLWHVALPVLCLVYAGFAVLSKQTRAAMLDNFTQDYVRTAKAKGVGDRDIVLRHVFRNSLLPLITMFVTIFPAMLAGSVVIEKIFTIPGMGSLILRSIDLRDRELLLANTLMIAAVNLLALLLADILYALADPRVSYE
jgi:peptide/nickel transport system permease protein